MLQSAATEYVVGRCPGCAAEHGAYAGGVCPACEIRLSPWCRIHSPRSGWLDGPACPRCAAVPAPARPHEPDGIPGQVFGMVFTLLFMAGAGGLMGLYAGSVYLARGGSGTLSGTPLQFGMAGVFLGLIFGFVVYGSFVGARSRQGAPPSLPPPVRDADPEPVRPPFRAPSAVPPLSAPASGVPSSAIPRSAASPGPVLDTRAPGRSGWPGGRSAREILRGAPKSADELGFPESTPPPSGGDVASLGCGGVIFGMLAGWLAGSATGADPAGASMVGAIMMGLAGLVVGIVRFAAIQHAAHTEDDL